MTSDHGVMADEEHALQSGTSGWTGFTRGCQIVCVSGLA